MLVQAARGEGEWFLCYEVSALALVECYNTGVLKTKYAGTFEVAAIRQEDSTITYDFILKKRGYCPIRFYKDYYRNRFMWASF